MQTLKKITNEVYRNSSKTMDGKFAINQEFLLKEINSKVKSLTSCKIRDLYLQRLNIYKKIWLRVEHIEQIRVAVTNEVFQ